MLAARPDPTPAEIRRHWLAAQRLADNDLPQQVALRPGLTLATVRELVADADFQVARDAEAAILALDPAAWERRMEGMMRQAAERALVDGKVSTLNLVLRARLELPAVAAKARSPGGRAAVRRAVTRMEDAEADADEPDAGEAAEPDPDAWLAEIPMVESDPSEESLRRALLGMIEHPVLRQMAGQGPLEGVEQLVVADDPVAYEEWFAKQPKVPFAPMDLPDSYKADILPVTRHNPPWARGEYLSYYRPPVPAHLFAADHADARGPHADPPPDQLGEGAGDDTAAASPPLPLQAGAWLRSDQGGGGASSTAELRTRIARLLDRDAQRLPDELDLAEAICAVKWPHWPEYRGAIDLFRLRRALQGTVIDARTLHWLGGKEIERACRAAGAGLAQRT